ncbi:MAG: hypothetical protein JNL72_04935 [Flavipsychrobacter sp.]|nr:hypothetical protein [Flavipsychrobacter sp.]
MESESSYERRQKKRRIFGWFLFVAIMSQFAILCAYSFAFDFSEFSRVSKVVSGYKWPIAIVITLLSAYGVFKVYTKRIVPSNRLLNFLVQLLGVTFISFFSTLITLYDITCSVEILNAVLGDGKKITIHGSVAKFEEARNSGRYGTEPISWYVHVTDTQLDRTLKVSVDTRYEVGDEFTGVFSIGKWGYLYSIRGK